MRHVMLCICFLFLVGCDYAVDPTGDLNLPNAAIVDAAHGGGTSGFYFLPPLVPDPTVSGTFDGDRLADLTVQVCQWTGAQCGAVVAAFDATGAGSERLRIDEEDEHYIVNWHTKQSALDPEDDYRIRVLDRGSELGYADVDVVSSGKELKNVDTGEYIALKDGRTLPIKFRIEARPFGNVPPIVFTSTFDGDFDVFAINPDGSGRIQISDLPGDERSPHWSRDGQWIGIRYITAGDAGDLVIMRPDGTDVRFLTSGAGIDRISDWTPDGRVIFDRGGVFYTIDVDGTDLQILSSFGNRNDGARVSPDGTTIAFEGLDAGGVKNAIFLMDIDGSNPRQLTNTSLGFNSHPNWSPDGGTLFSAAFRPADGNAVFDLYRVDVATGAVTFLLDLARQDVNPVPSPDGTRILFTADLEATAVSDLFILDLASGEIQRVTGPDGVFDGGPDWRR